MHRHPVTAAYPPLSEAYQGFFRNGRRCCATHYWRSLNAVPSRPFRKRLIDNAILASDTELSDFT